MNFQELQSRLGLELIESEWHRHSNGGGWVQNTASVDETAYVSEFACVSGSAHVSGSACVSGDACVSDNACVSGDAIVCGSARVSGTACVSGGAYVGGDAWVSGDVWEFSPLFIQGSRHSVAICSRSELQIGCKRYKINEWLKNLKEIGEDNDYSKDEIEEYKLYIECCAKWLEMKFGTELA